MSGIREREEVYKTVVLLYLVLCVGFCAWLVWE